MLDFVIDVIGHYFYSGFGFWWFFLFLALLFICTVPCILRSFLRR